MLEKRYLDGVEILSVNNRNLKNALKEIVHKVRSEHPEVEEIILFGSFSSCVGIYKSMVNGRFS